MLLKLWFCSVFLILCTELAASNEHDYERLEKLILNFEKKLDMMMTKCCNGASNVPSNCAEALAQAPHSGIHSIKLDTYGPNKFPVYCDADTQEGGWTVIQRRQDGSENFTRNWNDYKEGFGNLHGEFFIGLDKLHALTIDTPQELLIVMEDFNDVTKYAKYDAFVIGNESQNYTLNVVGLYSGDAGDSLKGHVSYRFLTFDRDTDDERIKFRAHSKGGWWYMNNFRSNLNGVYWKNEKEANLESIQWRSWKLYQSLKSTKMLIRPKRN